MDAQKQITKYAILAISVVVVIYAIAHVDMLREKILGLPALSA